MCVFKCCEKCEMRSELRGWAKNVVTLWREGFYLNGHVFYKCLHSLA